MKTQETEGKAYLLVTFTQRFVTKSKLSLIFTETLLFPHKTTYLNDQHDLYENADCNSVLLPPIRAAEIVECVCKYVSMWRESHKIFKIWALINQTLPRCVRSYGLWINKSNYRAKKVDISESTNTNQSISLKQFYPNRSVNFHPRIVLFSHNPPKFNIFNSCEQSLLFK